MWILLDGLVQNGDAYWYVFMTQLDHLYNMYIFIYLFLNTDKACALKIRFNCNLLLYLCRVPMCT